MPQEPPRWPASRPIAFDSIVPKPSGPSPTASLNVPNQPLSFTPPISRVLRSPAIAILRLAAQTDHRLFRSLGFGNSNRSLSFGKKIHFCLQTTNFISLVPPESKSRRLRARTGNPDLGKQPNAKTPQNSPPKKAKKPLVRSRATRQLCSYLCPQPSLVHSWYLEASDKHR